MKGRYRVLAYLEDRALFAAAFFSTAALVLRTIGRGPPPDEEAKESKPRKPRRAKRQSQTEIPGA